MLPQCSNSRVEPTVKNPLMVRGKGRPSNKRIIGTEELNNKSNNKKKKTNKDDNSSVLEPIVSFDNCEFTNMTISRDYMTQNTQAIQPLHEIQNLNTIPLQSSSTQFPRFFEPTFLFDELNLGKYNFYFI